MCFSKLSEVCSGFLVVAVLQRMEFARKQGYSKIALEIERSVFFSELFELSSRILVVVSKTMEVVRKQSYCDISFEIEKTACFFQISEVSSRILGVVSKMKGFRAQTRLPQYCSLDRERSVFLQIS